MPLSVYADALLLFVDYYFVCHRIFATAAIACRRLLITDARFIFSFFYAAFLLLHCRRLILMFFFPFLIAFIAATLYFADADYFFIFDIGLRPTPCFFRQRRAITLPFSFRFLLCFLRFLRFLRQLLRFLIILPLMMPLFLPLSAFRLSFLLPLCFSLSLWFSDVDAICRFLSLFMIFICHWYFWCCHADAEMPIADVYWCAFDADAAAFHFHWFRRFIFHFIADYRYFIYFRRHFIIFISFQLFFAIISLMLLNIFFFRLSPLSIASIIFFHWLMLLLIFSPFFRLFHFRFRLFWFIKVIIYFRLNYALSRFALFRWCHDGCRLILFSRITPFHYWLFAIDDDWFSLFSYFLLFRLIFRCRRLSFSPFISLRHFRLSIILFSLSCHFFDICFTFFLSDIFSSPFHFLHLFIDTSAVDIFLHPIFAITMPSLSELLLLLLLMLAMPLAAILRRMPESECRLLIRRFMLMPLKIFIEDHNHEMTTLLYFTIRHLRRCRAPLRRYAIFAAWCAIHSRTAVLLRLRFICCRSVRAPLLLCRRLIYAYERAPLLIMPRDALRCARRRDFCQRAPLLLLRAARRAYGSASLLLTPSSLRRFTFLIVAAADYWFIDLIFHYWFHFTLPSCHYVSFHIFIVSFAIDAIALSDFLLLHLLLFAADFDTCFQFIYFISLFSFLSSFISLPIIFAILIAFFWCFVYIAMMPFLSFFAYAIFSCWFIAADYIDFHAAADDADADAYWFFRFLLRWLITLFSPLRHFFFFLLIYAISFSRHAHYFFFDLRWLMLCFSSPPSFSLLAFSLSPSIYFSILRDYCMMPLPFHAFFDWFFIFRFRFSSPFSLFSFRRLLMLMLLLLFSLYLPFHLILPLRHAAFAFRQLSSFTRWYASDVDSRRCWCRLMPFIFIDYLLLLHLISPLFFAAACFDFLLLFFRYMLAVFSLFHFYWLFAIDYAIFSSLSIIFSFCFLSPFSLISPRFH